MPASSRKRNKGKERKAKKAAEKEGTARELEAAEADLCSTWQNWFRGNMIHTGDGFPMIQCNLELVKRYYLTNLILFQVSLIHTSCATVH